MFYTYNQNNSGGSFDYDGDTGIAEYVIVEADSAEAASIRAQEIGLYFDGCDTGLDCSCCGDRWVDVWNDDNGEEYPAIYGKNATIEREYVSRMMADGISKAWTRKGNFTTFVHYADGAFKGFGQA